MKKINELQVSSLGNIYHKIAQLEHLQNKIKPLLPQELCLHCCVANFEKGILVFAVQNSAWAMRLRFLIPELLTKLRSEEKLHQLTSIEYYIEADYIHLFDRSDACKGTIR